MKKWICFLLLLAMAMCLFAACTLEEDRPANGSGQQMAQPEAEKVPQRPADTTYEAAYMELALDLFHRSVAAGGEENLLISPLSIQLALAMTANGADGQTLQEMESALGRGIPLEQLNEYLHSYADGLPSEKKAKLSIANSIWFRDRADQLTVNESFLQTNSNYYGAEVFKRDFNATTLKEINNWVDHNTDGMIDKIIDTIDDASMMYLINAMAFEAEWAEPYNEYAISEGSFTTLAGNQQTVSMLHGSETTYLSDGRATGFTKPYAGGKYSFAVLLPNEGEDLYDYISSLTGQQLAEMLNSTEDVKVITQMPKFSYEFELTMNDILAEMGMPTAFDGKMADLSRLGSSTAGNLYIGKVLHKTFIQVDGMGTRAGAATSVEIYCGSANAPATNIKEVIVDRPFVYMILDNETNLPIFMGCVTEIPA